MKHAIAIITLLASLNSYSLGGNGDSPYIYSEGKNYKQLGKVNVDPRTGNLSFNYQLGGIMANLKRGPKLTLTAQYNSLETSNRFQIGRGWNFNITHYEPEHQHLVLGNDSSHKIVLDQQGNPQTQYQKLKNIQIRTSPEPDMLLEILYKAGHKEKINKWGQMTELCGQSGECLLFDYDIESSALKKISSNSNPNVITLDKQQGNIVITANRADGKSYQTTLVQAQGLLVGIQPGVPNTDPITFEYGSDGLIHAINLPGGGTHEFEYTSLPVPTGGPVSHVPAVKRWVSRANHGQPGRERRYCYAGLGGSHCQHGDGRSYLGYASGISYIPNEDNLFHRDQSYTYQTETHHSDKIEIRTFNKFHLLVHSQTTTPNNQPLREHRIGYPAPGSTTFDQLPPNYQLPTSVETHYFSPQTPGSSRTTRTHNTYDDYGNPTSKTDAMGRLTTYTYCPVTPSGQQGCPQSQTPFVRYLLTKNSHNQDQTQVHTLRYSYEKIDSPFGGEIILKKGKDLVINGVKIKSEQRQFYRNPNEPHYGYLQQKQVTAKSKSSLIHQTYQQAQQHNQLRIRQTISDSEYYDKHVSLHHVRHPVLASQTIQGDAKEINYDAAARVIYEKLTKGTTEQERHHHYVQTQGNNFVESVYHTGYKRKTTFDGLGRKIGEYAAYDGQNYVQIASYDYNTDGYLQRKTLYNKDQHTGAYNLVTTYEYDSLGRKIRTTNALGVTSRKEYDDVSNSVTEYKTSKTGQMLAKRTVRKNDEGKKIQIIQYYTNGHLYAQQNFAYEGFGRVKTKTINGRSTSYAYDDANFRRSSTDPLGTTAHFDLDPLSHKPEQVQINSRLLGKLEYDPFGRMIAVTDPEGHQRHMHYQGGLLATQEDALGNQTRYTYKQALLEKKTFQSHDGSEHATEVYSYNQFNQLEKVGSDTTEVIYDYALDGKKTKETRGYQHPSATDSYVQTYAYDQLRKLSELTDDKGNRLEHVRNQHGQLQAVRYNGQDYLSYSYDGFGRVQTVSRIDNIQTQYEYDEFSRPIHIKHSKDGAVLESYRVDYDNDNRVARIKTNKSNYSKTRTDTYGYDPLNRLISYKCEGHCSDFSDSIGIGYNYDSFNNLTYATVWDNAQNALLAHDEYKYPATGNPVKLLSMDTSNSQGSSTVSLTYNANNQVVREQHSDSIAGAPFHIEYHYDVRGNLVRIVKDTDNSLYLYDERGRIIYSQFNGNLPEITYYFNKHPLLTVQDGKTSFNIGKGQLISVGEQGNLHRLYSSVGNISAVFDPREGAWSRFNYLPYGQQVVEQGVSKKRGFQGNLVDSTSGQVVYGNGQRFYSPRLRRFMAYDTGYSPFGKGGFNGFAYGGNSPTNYSDPSGHSIWLILLNVLMMVGGELVDPAGGGAAAEAAAETVEGEVATTTATTAAATGTTEATATATATTTTTATTATTAATTTTTAGEELGAVGGAEDSSISGENIAENITLGRSGGERQAFWRGYFMNSPLRDSAFTLDNIQSSDRAFFLQTQRADGGLHVDIFDRRSLEEWVSAGNITNPINREPLSPSDIEALGGVGAGAANPVADVPAVGVPGPEFNEFDFDNPPPAMWEIGQSSWDDFWIPSDESQPAVPRRYDDL